MCKIIGIGEGSDGYPIRKAPQGNTSSTGKIEIQMTKPADAPQTKEIGDKLLTESPYAAMGISLGNIKPKVCAPDQHPEIVAMSNQQIATMGFTPVSREHAAELNANADLAFVTETVTSRQSKTYNYNPADVEKHMASFLPDLDIAFGIS